MSKNVLEALAEYRDELVHFGDRSPRHGMNTWNAVARSTLPRMAAFHDVAAEDMTLDMITRSDVAKSWREYAATGKAQNTVVQVYDRTQAFLTWCANVGYIERNPGAGLPRPKVGRVELRILTPDEIVTLTAAAEFFAWPARDRLAVLFTCVLGVRAGELHSMKVSGITTSPPGIQFVGKGGHERWVPLPPVMQKALAVYLRERERQLARVEVESDALFVALRSYKDSYELNSHAIGELFRKIMKRVGAFQGNGASHCGRRAWATAARSSGVYDGKAYRQQLGHTHRETTDRYLRVPREELYELSCRHPFSLLPFVGEWVNEPLQNAA